MLKVWNIALPLSPGRFRQLEVLQQVTTTFSNLVGGPGSDPSSSQTSTEARERRKRVATLLRRAARKTLRQERTSQAKPSSAASDPESLVDKRNPPKRSKVSDSSSLSPVKEELSVSSKPVVRVTPDALKPDSIPSSVGKGTREPSESFVLEEVKSSGSAVTSSVCRSTLLRF